MIYIWKKEIFEVIEELLFDVNELVKEKSYYLVVGLFVSFNNKILVFGEDVVFRRIYIIRFKNLEIGEWIEDRIFNIIGKVVWVNDNKMVFYLVKDEIFWFYKIFKYCLGEVVEKDVEVFYEKDEIFNIYVYKIKFEKYIVIVFF